MTRALETLTEARRLGLEVVPNGADLRIRGPRAFRDAMRNALLRHKAEIVEILEDERRQFEFAVEARSLVFRSMVDPSRPLPVLSLPDIQPGPGDCWSCGDPLPDPTNWSRRCTACAAAARKVAREVSAAWEREIRERAARMQAKFLGDGE